MDAMSLNSENRNLKRRLQQTICAGRLFHSYILEGPQQDTRALAEWLVRAALCQRQDGTPCGMCAACRKLDNGNSEDVFRIGAPGPGRAIKDEEVEKLISRATKKSYTGHRLFLVIEDADFMTLRAQNRLLKTMEEPPAMVTILLLSENAEALVQTIRSRSQILRLFSDGMEHGNKDGQLSEFRERSLRLAAAVITGKPVYRFWKEIAAVTDSKEKGIAFLSAAESFYRDLLISGYDPSGHLLLNREFRELVEQCRYRVRPEQAAMAIACAERAAKDLSINVGAKHAVKCMIFDIQEKLNDNNNRSQI